MSFNYARRLECLRQLLAENQIDGLLTAHRDNVFYLCGFWGSAGVALVTEESASLFVDGRYVLQAAVQAVGFSVEPVKPNARWLMETAALALPSEKKRLGYETHSLTCNTLNGLQKKLAEERPDLELVATEGLIERVRRVKEPAEIERIEAAVALADEAHRRALDTVRSGVKESEVGLEYDFYLRRRRAREPFETIVAFGKNSAFPHHQVTERALKVGDFIKFDYGAKLDGYCSDATRTYCLGKATQQQEEMYKAVLEAQEAAIAFISPGKTCQEVDQIARDVIAAAGYEEHFSHNLGHGLGIAIHESPRLAKGEETVLEPNMVLTVEPGIYIPDVGGVRVEDLVLVTEKGARILTTCPKSERLPVL